MSESKYATQIRNLRKNYVRFSLDLKPDILARFRQVCTSQGTTPTTEIKRFISSYCEKHGDDLKQGGEMQ